MVILVVIIFYFGLIPTELSTSHLILSFSGSFCLPATSSRVSESSNLSMGRMKLKPLTVFQDIVFRHGYTCMYLIMKSDRTKEILPSVPYCGYINLKVLRLVALWVLYYRGACTVVLSLWSPFGVYSQLVTR